MSEIAILILTEDSSRWASATIEAVGDHVLGLLVPQFDKSGLWLSFAPANKPARAAMRANRWKSKKSRDQGGVLSLCEAIASHILRPDGFVFFHFDADAIPGAPSRNIEEFERVIVGKVHTLVQGKTASPSRAAYVMTKLIAVTPYYAIETWLFANVEQLRRLGATDPVLDAWAADPSALDRVAAKIELRNVSTRDYPALAQTMKAEQLYALGSSFCDTVNRAGACSSLVIRLRAHWPGWVRSLYHLD